MSKWYIETQSYERFLCQKRKTSKKNKKTYSSVKYLFIKNLGTDVFMTMFHSFILKKQQQFSEEIHKYRDNNYFIV